MRTIYENCIIRGSKFFNQLYIRKLRNHAGTKWNVFKKQLHESLQEVSLDQQSCD